MITASSFGTQRIANLNLDWLKKITLGLLHVKDPEKNNELARNMAQVPQEQAVIISRGTSTMLEVKRPDGSNCNH